MIAKSKQSGLSLIETAVVVASVVLLISLGVPAVRALIRSFETEGGARNMISGGLSSARTIALKNHRYAGIRFQKAYNRENPTDLLSNPQYMIFIIHDSNLVDAESVASKYFDYEFDGFRAVKGIQPIKLPETVGVIRIVDELNEIDEDDEVIDNTTISVVFSPAGKLVTRSVAVLRKDINDDVFNGSVNNPMFLDDYEDTWPYWEELSEKRFVIYDRVRFEKLSPAERFGYLQNFKPVYINAYMGTLITGK